MKRLNLFAMRAVGVLLATVKWTLDDIVDVGGEAILALVEFLGNVVQLVVTIAIGPFLMLRKAYGLRKFIKEDSTWTKPRKSSTK
jgi:hypothetical protein